MKLLITGICGFAGSTIACALQDQRRTGESLTIVGVDTRWGSPGVPHEAINLSATELARAVVARNDPAEQDKVEPFVPGRGAAQLKR